MGYGILPCRLNSFTLAAIFCQGRKVDLVSTSPISSRILSKSWVCLSQDFLGTVKSFVAYLISTTYSRGPFIRSVQNIANMYCTECIIGIVQNAGTPSRLRFARTRRDER